MKTLIVVAHPKIDDSSSQAFFKAGATLVEDATWHPLVEPFDVREERALLMAADRIILQFPLYWYQAPSSLPKWLNEVWSVDFASHLKGKQLAVVLTLGRQLQDYQPGAAVGVTLSDLLSPYVALANTCEMTWVPPLVVAQFARMTEAQRQSLLIRYQQFLSLPDTHFQTISQWWVDQLNKRPEAAQIAQTLQERQEHLASLRQSVKEAQDDE